MPGGFARESRRGQRLDPSPPGADPHSLIDDGATPPRATKNYWPVALPAQTLSSSNPTAPVEVLAVTIDVGTSAVTGYAVRKADGSIGVFLINKGNETIEVAVDLPANPQSVMGRRIGRTEYDAASGPAQMSVRVESRRVTITLPPTSMAGLDIR